MTLKEAVQSGKLFRRKAWRWGAWYTQIHDDCGGYGCSDAIRAIPEDGDMCEQHTLDVEDIFADDYEVSE